MEQIDLNVQAYKLLFRIENGLRSFIEQTLGAEFGPKWWKQQIPGDIREQCEDHQKEEREKRWLDYQTVHPICYSYLDDLKKTIVRGDNWDKVFAQYFGQVKIIVESKLTELEPLRNKIAHNRPVTEMEVQKLALVWRELQQCMAASSVGHSTESIATVPSLRRMDDSVAREIAEQLGQLAVELQNNRNRLTNLESAALEKWTEVQTKWWFSPEFMNLDPSDLRDGHELLAEYNALPRYPGCGNRLETYLRSNNVLSHVDRCLRQVNNEVERLRARII